MAEESVFARMVCTGRRFLGNQSALRYLNGENRLPQRCVGADAGGESGVDAVEARVTLHDVSGRRVASVFEGRLDAGSHRLEARGSFAHGMYFARAEVRRAAGVTVLVAKVPYRR